LVAVLFATNPKEAIWKMKVLRKKSDVDYPLMPLQFLGKRVITTVMPGVAATDPFNTQPYTFDNTVFGDRLDGILGTGRRKSAIRPQQRADRIAVSIDDPNQNAGHNL
jgi:hypothetical protein